MRPCPRVPPLGPRSLGLKPSGLLTLGSFSAHVWVDVYKQAGAKPLYFNYPGLIKKVELYILIWVLKILMFKWIL